MCGGHETINFKTATRGGAPIRSLALITHPASWIEREIHDFFAVDFIGHPNLVPLLRPPGLERWIFSRPGPRFDPANETIGERAMPYTIPVGPYHPALEEPFKVNVSASPKPSSRSASTSGSASAASSCWRSGANGSPTSP